MNRVWVYVKVCVIPGWAKRWKTRESGFDKDGQGISNVNGSNNARWVRYTWASLIPSDPFPMPHVQRPPPSELTASHLRSRRNCNTRYCPPARYRQTRRCADLSEWHSVCFNLSFQWDPAVMNLCEIRLGPLSLSISSITLRRSGWSSVDVELSSIVYYTPKSSAPTLSLKVHYLKHICASLLNCYNLTFHHFASIKFSSCHRISRPRTNNPSRISTHSFDIFPSTLCRGQSLPAAAVYGSVNGTSPVNIVNNSTPNDHISAGSARYPEPFNISGDAKFIVP